MDGAAAEARDNRIADKPDAVGRFDLRRGFRSEAQQLTRHQARPAMSDLLPEPCRPKFLGERIIKLPSPWIEPTDDPAERETLRVKELQGAPLAGYTDGLNVTGPARVEGLIDRLVSCPPDFVEVLFHAAISKLEQSERAGAAPNRAAFLVRDERLDLGGPQVEAKQLGQIPI